MQRGVRCDILILFIKMENLRFWEKTGMADKPSRCLLAGGSSEITVKKSRFIATFAPVKSYEEACAFIEQMKKKYWNASHNCYAYIIGEDMLLQRYSDDGEPQGTAGKPMLEVLIAQGLHDTAVVVTRYFGGTLLGTGGLIRAYSQAVSDGLLQTVILEKLDGFEVVIQTDYNNLGKVEYCLASNSIARNNTDYTDQVKITLLTTEEELALITKELSELTNGKISINKVQRVKFAASADKRFTL